MAHLSEIVQFCNDRTRLASVPDFPGAANGLQIGNSGTVVKIGAAVDAGLTPFKMAIEAGIDFLIVHHGLFWGPAYPVTDLLYEKYKLCFENNLAVYSSHLPLDCHPEIGNNALLAEELGLKPLGGFMEFEGNSIGLITEGDIPVDEIRSRLTRLFPAGFIPIEKGSGIPAKIAVASGSGASAVSELKALGVDTLITGELKQHHFNQAEEERLNLYLCGHYATETFGVSALAAEAASKFDLQWKFLPTACPL